MSCLPATRRAQLKARLTTKLAQLDNANIAMDELSTQTIESYKFDSGEGSQQTKRRSLEDLTNLISSLEASIDLITRKLNRTGFYNVNVRR